MNKFGFSFGACLWGPIFFGAHKAYGFMFLSIFMCFIPFIAFIWMIVCGFCGAEWAYRRAGLTEDQFSGSLESWNRSGLIIFVLMFVIAFVGIIAAVAIPGYMKYMELSKQKNQNVEGFLNKPAIEIQLDEVCDSAPDFSSHFNLICNT